MPKQTQSQINYRNSERGKIINKISNWKSIGLKCDTREDYNLIYDKWLNSSRCEECNCVYSKDNKKCMDHDHNTGLFRNILCFNCNKNLNCRNTSGIPNISKYKNGWIYCRVIKGKRHRKCSKDLEWLKNYKKEFELKHIYIH